MENEKDWKFCAIGNIVRTRIDDEGKEWHGTAAFRPGAKVYLRGRCWKNEKKEITVIGFTRKNKYRELTIPINVIENVRAARVFNPKVIDMMTYTYFNEQWWDKSSFDKRDVKRFASEWNDNVKPQQICVNEKNETNILKKLKSALTIWKGKKNV